MATEYVDYELSNLGDLEITCFKNIGRELKKNGIIPTYQTYLEKVKTCIEMLYDLEKNRWFGFFCDWTHGERRNINVPRLEMHLYRLKIELETGIRQYERLLKMYEKMLKYERILTFSRYKLSDKITSTKIPEISLMNHVGRGAICAGGGAVVGGIAGASIGGILAYSGMLKVSSLAVLGASTGVGVLAVGAAGGAMYLVYTVANSCGRKRGVKYHQVKALSDTLDVYYLANIKTNHEDLKTIYDIMDKRIKELEVTLEQAKTVYSEAKRNSFQTLTKEKYDDEVCELMSKRDAKKDCKYFLIRKLDCLPEEAEEYVKQILK